MNMNVMSTEDLAQWRGGLVSYGKDKDSERKKDIRDRQRHLCHIVANEGVGKFLDEFKNFRISMKAEVPENIDKYTESEFHEPPLSTEWRTYFSLQDLPRRLAASPAFWASYHLSMIKEGCIKPFYLAKNSNATGQERIQEAISMAFDTPGGSAKKLDDCARTILRRFCGLREERGYLSVFVDCRTSRGWWRSCLVREAMELYEGSNEALWEVVRASKVWERLMGYMVERLTVLADTNVRAAILTRLSTEDLAKIDKKNLDSFFLGIGRLNAYKNLGALPLKKLLKEIQELTL